MASSSILDLDEEMDDLIIITDTDNEFSDNDVIQDNYETNEIVREVEMLPERSWYGNKNFSLPVTFFDHTRNVCLLKKCRALSVQVIDYKKYPWYYKKQFRLQSPPSTSQRQYSQDVKNLVTDINKTNSHEDNEIDSIKLKIPSITIKRSEIQKKICYEVVESTSPRKGAHDVQCPEINETAVKAKELNNEVINKPIILGKVPSNTPRSSIDFKKNEGLVGLKILNKPDTALNNDKKKRKRKIKDKITNNLTSNYHLKLAGTKIKGIFNKQSCGNKKIHKSNCQKLQENQPLLVNVNTNPENKTMIKEISDIIKDANIHKPMGTDTHNLVEGKENTPHDTDKPNNVSTLNYHKVPKTINASDEKQSKVHNEQDVAIKQHLNIPCINSANVAEKTPCDQQVTVDTITDRAFSPILPCPTQQANPQIIALNNFRKPQDQQGQEIQNNHELYLNRSPIKYINGHPSADITLYNNFSKDLYNAYFPLSTNILPLIEEKTVSVTSIQGEVQNNGPYNKKGELKIQTVSQINNSIQNKVETLNNKKNNVTLSPQTMTTPTKTTYENQALPNRPSENTGFVKLKSTTTAINKRKTKQNSASNVIIRAKKIKVTPIYDPKLVKTYPAVNNIQTRAPPNSAVNPSVPIHSSFSTPTNYTQNLVNQQNSGLPFSSQPSQRLTNIMPYRYQEIARPYPSMTPHCRHQQNTSNTPFMNGNVNCSDPLQNSMSYPWYPASTDMPQPRYDNFENAWKYSPVKYPTTSGTENVNMYQMPYVDQSFNNKSTKFNANEVNPNFVFYPFANTAIPPPPLPLEKFFVDTTKPPPPLPKTDAPKVNNSADENINQRTNLLPVLITRKTNEVAMKEKHEECAINQFATKNVEFPKSNLQDINNPSSEKLHNKNLVLSKLLNESPAKVNTRKSPEESPKFSQPKATSVTPEKKPIAKGYSPPILPIPTVEKSLEMLAMVNRLNPKANYDYVTSCFFPTSAPMPKNNIQPSILSHGNEKKNVPVVPDADKRANKISLEEYKKRIGKSDDHESGTGGKIGKNRRKSERQSLDQLDLGYDSDAAIH